MQPNRPCRTLQLAADALRATRMADATVMGERPLKATVRVGNFENRVRQGCGADSLAMAYAGSAGMTAGCAHMGVELTDLVGQPVESIQDGASRTASRRTASTSSSTRTTARSWRSSGPRNSRARRSRSRPPPCPARTCSGAPTRPLTNFWATRRWKPRCWKWRTAEAPWCPPSCSSDRRAAATQPSDTSATLSTEPGRVARPCAGRCSGMETPKPPSA